MSYGLINIQGYVNLMCESVNAMKLTPRQKDHARAVMRAAIEYANANAATQKTAEPTPSPLSAR